MWKYIYRHKLFQIAQTIFAETDEEAETKLKDNYIKLSEMGIDIPHYSTFECVNKQHVE